ncbi:hypothetical protein HAX54_008736, partial [Datura stramonium]|nr:hypothetical protein [Datura stramonium]
MLRQCDILLYFCGFNNVTHRYNDFTSKQEATGSFRIKGNSKKASDEGSDDTESDGDNPPVDNAEEGNDEAEKSRNDATNAEESGDKDSSTEGSNEQGSISMKKKIPDIVLRRSQKIQINALNEVPELKRLFEGYNMYWMDKTPSKYNMEMV